MPQFDKITFFNQTFWVSVVFLVFYFWFLKQILPVIVLGLKTRKKGIKCYLEISSGTRLAFESKVKSPFSKAILKSKINDYLF